MLIKRGYIKDLSMDVHANNDVDNKILFCLGSPQRATNVFNLLLLFGNFRYSLSIVSFDINILHQFINVQILFLLLSNYYYCKPIFLSMEFFLLIFFLHRFHFFHERFFVFSNALWPTAKCFFITYPNLLCHLINETKIMTY